MLLTIKYFKIIILSFCIFVTTILSSCQNKQIPYGFSDLYVGNITGYNYTYFTKAKLNTPITYSFKINSGTCRKAVYHNSSGTDVEISDPTESSGTTYAAFRDQSAALETLSFLGCDTGTAISTLQSVEGYAFTAGFVVTQ